MMRQRFKKFGSLPGKPSELIRLALKGPKEELDKIGLANYLGKEFAVDDDYTLDPTLKEFWAIIALRYLQRGALHAGFRGLDINPPKGLAEVVYIPQEIAHLEAMRELADELAERGY